MKVESNPESIRLFQRKLFDFCSNIGLTNELIIKINLAVEEVLMNIASYAYAGEKHEKIAIDLAHEENQIKITIMDMGPPFNINERKDGKPIISSFDKTGGWGIFIVKNIMDKIEYTRVNECNIVSLFKNI